MTDEEWLKEAMYAGGVWEAFEVGMSHTSLDEETSDIYGMVREVQELWWQADPYIHRLTRRMETLHD